MNLRSLIGLPFLTEYYDTIGWETKDRRMFSAEAITKASCDEGIGAIGLKRRL